MKNTERPLPHHILIQANAGTYICRTLLTLVILFSSIVSVFPQQRKSMEVGVARIDITPDGPIRLAGFAVREKSESQGVLQHLSAKALAFGTDKQLPSILITVDLIGIP